MTLLEPKEIEMELPSGGTKTYILSKFPSWQGREIMTQYPLSGLPKIGDYKVNEEIAAKLFNFVAVPMKNGAEPLRLSTHTLVENHIPSWETVAKLEIKMIEYNCSFFLDGTASTFLSALAEKIPEKIIEMLMRFWEQSSIAAKPPSTS